MKIIIVNGFLGSGKTTLIKQLINIYKTNKIGLIINEFGNINIDKIEFESLNLLINDINNGSIFCSCKSDKFLDAIVDLYNKDMELLIVESSGLSDPISINTIFDSMQKMTNNGISDILVITTIDASNLHKIINTLTLVKKQIEIADIILINKIDIATKDQIKNSIEIIKEINPFCFYKETIKANINNTDLLNKRYDFNKLEKVITKRNLLLDTLTITDILIDETTLKTLLNILNKQVFRIKGYINNLKIDTSFNEFINIEKTSIIGNYLVLLFSKDLIIKSKILSILDDLKITYNIK